MDDILGWLGDVQVLILGVIGQRAGHPGRLHTAGLGHCGAGRMYGESVPCSTNHRQKQWGDHNLQVQPDKPDNGQTGR